MTRALNPRGTRDKAKFPDACHELTDSDVESLYGAYIRHGVEQMARDIDPLVAMAESANQILRHREQLEARKRQEASVARVLNHLAERESVSA